MATELTDLSVNVDEEADNLLAMKPEFRKDNKNGKGCNKKLNTVKLDSRRLMNDLISVKNTPARSSERIAAAANRGIAASISDKDTPQAMLSNLKNDVSAINDKFSNVCTILSNCLDRIDVVEDDLENMKSQVAQHEAKLNSVLDDLEFYKRKDRQNQVLFTFDGLNTSENNIKAAVCKILNESMKLTLQFAQVVKIKKFGDGLNTVLMTLPSFDAKIKLFRAAKVYNDNKEENQPRLYFNDFLTPRTTKLLKDIRGINKNLSDHNCFHAVFTYNGRIFVKKSKDDSPELIRSVKEFTGMISG